MIKFEQILLEAKRVKLSPETITTLKNAVELIFRRRLRGFSKRTKITNLPIIIADGTPGSVEIIVDPDIDEFAYISDKNEENEGATLPDDFILVVNPNKVISKKGLYLTLYHEIMHATDPTFSTRYSEKYWNKYDIESDEGYYGHMVEFRAFVNEFLEGLVNEFVLRRGRIKNEKKIKELRDSLENILNHFAKNEPLSPVSKDILKDMIGYKTDFKLREFIKRFWSRQLGEEPDDFDYLDILIKIKDNIGKEWKRFLNMLYHTVEEIRDSIV